MIVTLLLVLGIPSQAPAVGPGPARPATAAASPRAPAPLDLKARREADLKKLVEKKKAQQQQKSLQRAARKQREYQEARAQQEYNLKMAPILARQRAEAARLAIDQQRANALSSMANAAQKEAAIDLGRLRLEQKEAGVPFVPTPNGLQPYPYAAGGTP